MYPYSVGVLNFILHVLSIHVKWNYMYSLLMLFKDWIVDYIYFYLFYKIWSLCSGFWLFNICIPLLVCFDSVKISLEWYCFIILKILIFRHTLAWKWIFFLWIEYAIFRWFWRGKDQFFVPIYRQTISRQVYLNCRDRFQREAGGNTHIFFYSTIVVLF